MLQKSGRMSEDSMQMLIKMIVLDYEAKNRHIKPFFFLWFFHMDDASQYLYFFVLNMA